MILQLISACLFLAVAVISFIMALKGLSVRQFLPFHANSAGVQWDSLDRRLQAVIVSMVRINGYAFLIVSIQLIIGLIGNFFWANRLLQSVSASMAFVFCLGLFLSNYRLHLQTNAKTPWKGSLFAALALAIGLILSMSL